LLLFRYLVESIQKFHTQEELARLTRQAGFRFVSHTNLTAGVVAVHSGMKLS
jgi:ubiquinone/menaquinone biosynthesis C-methylase UbiE